MESLDEEQEKALLEYMNERDGSSWKKMAGWATEVFGVPVTADECEQFYYNAFLDNL